jgi:hypothetical protein
MTDIKTCGNCGVNLLGAQEREAGMCGHCQHPCHDCPPPKSSTRRAVEDAINASKGDKSKPWPTT